MKEKDRDIKMKLLLTKEFLDTLVEVGKLYGWRGDYVEIVGFIEGLHEDAGIGYDFSNTDPYEIEYDES